MIRCGNGYDAHRLAPNRKLILGGVEIAHTYGLEGHSDADVLSHAIADALLGAVALALPLAFLAVVPSDAVGATTASGLTMRAPEELRMVQGIVTFWLLTQSEAKPVAKAPRLMYWLMRA